MMKIKKLYIFLLNTYVPLFVMTFGICLFIILMQFLWKYVDEMVGKGISLDVLGEFFFYSALSFVPMSLPLAILLASLMTFGNLGENFELLAMKSSGISLPRIMKPMVVFLCLVAAGSFYFQNDIIPSSQVKMYTLLYSMKQKSPELEIPESIFYNEIQGYNIYVREKERDGLLRDMMIYDYSQGFNNAQVTIADSGRLKMATDKLHLILSLYSGETFENLRKQNRNTPNKPEAVPYQKEKFTYKELLIEFDANFNRASESLMQDRYIGKNLRDLSASIDSMTHRTDSIKSEYSKQIYASSYRKSLRDYGSNVANARTTILSQLPGEIDFDKLYASKSEGVRLSILNRSKASIERITGDYSLNAMVLTNEEKEIRRHHVEMHKKFTLSLACLIFFFIGAPLGAIIRKGGLGMPVIISVFLFIFYYIIDRIGTTMATNGMWLPWQGMWFSTAILFPFGMFLTYKATHDSVLLDSEAYADKLKKFFGQRIARKIEKKEIIMYNLDYESFTARVENLLQQCETYLKQNKQWMSYFAFWKHAGDDRAAMQIASEVEAIAEEGNNSEHNLVLNKLMDYPFIRNHSFLQNVLSNKKICVFAAWFFPVGLLVYLAAVVRRKYLLRDISVARQVSEELLDTIRKLQIKEKCLN